MRLALDTNRYVDLCHGDARAVEAVQSADAVIVPFITLGELRAGFRRGSRTESNERIFARFLQSDRVSVLFPDEATTHVYAELYSDLRRKGQLIPANDLWLAALCVQHDLILFTRDEHFDVVPRLARL